VSTGAVDAKRDLAWDQLLEHLAQRAHTERGAEHLRQLSLFEDVAAARRRIDEIAEARDLLDSDEALGFAQVSDIRLALARAAKGGMLDGEQLLAVARTAHAAARLRKHVDQRAERVPLLAEVVAGIADVGHVYFPIEDSLDADARLVDHASDALGGLRRKVNQLRGQLDTRAQKFIAEPKNADLLQDSYYTQRDERYVVPVKVEAQAFVRGIVHGTSQSGHTVFVEPEALVELNNKLKLAECAVADEERRILLQLTEYVAEEVDNLRRIGELVLHLDVIAAAAKMARDLDASPPTIADDGDLDVHTMRHPLMVLSGRHCVPNNLKLPPRSVLVISGPNAGGKTVALKSVGVLALLVRAGLHIPAAPGSRVPWYEQIHADIGDAQSLENDLSTFSARLTKLRRFLAEADAHTLLLLDEVAVGTEPEQGAALAAAVLEAFADKGVATIATTHYERLKALAAADDRFHNASVGFDLDELAPTFQLHLGTPGSSGALYVARALNLPAAVVDRAESLLGDRRATVEELMVDLAEQRRVLTAERALVEAAKDDAERARRKAADALAVAEEKRKSAHKAEHNAAVTALRDARAELDRLRAKVRRKVSAKAVSRGAKQVDALGKQIAGAAPEPPPPPGRAARPDELRPGSTVYVPSLGGAGEVVAEPVRGKVSVRVGSFNTTVSADELRIVPTRPSAPQTSTGRDKQRGATAERRRSMLAGNEATASSPQRIEVPPAATLDLRGERVDDALGRVDRFLDESLVQVRDVICIIHGHGTGALREAVRSHIKLHPSVTDWRPGGPKEGGDGVTLVALDVR